MANAKIDDNNVKTILGTSSVDGTPVLIKAKESNGALYVETGSSGTGASDVASRDDDFNPVLLAVSSVDGITPVTVSANPTTGAILIQTT